MRRWLLVPVLLLCSCGAVVVQTGFENTDITETGVVSFVQFTAVSDGHGSLINVTIVTLTQSGIGRDFRFCGNHPNRFPVNSLVSTRFRPGQNCGSLLSVAIERRG